MRKIEIEWSRMITGWTSEDLNEFVPDHDGIYIIYYWNKSKWEKFTFGKGNLKQKLSDFLSEKKKNVFLQIQLSGCSCGFVFTELESKIEMDGILKYLHDSCKWKWIQYPQLLDVEPVEVSFPEFDRIS